MGYISLFGAILGNIPIFPVIFHIFVIKQCFSCFIAIIALFSVCWLYTAQLTVQSLLGSKESSFLLWAYCWVNRFLASSYWPCKPITTNVRTIQMFNLLGYRFRSISLCLGMFRHSHSLESLPVSLQNRVHKSLSIHWSESQSSLTCLFFLTGEYWQEWSDLALHLLRNASAFRRGHRE